MKKNYKARARRLDNPKRLYWIWYRERKKAVKFIRENNSIPASRDLTKAKARAKVALRQMRRYARKAGMPIPSQVESLLDDPIVFEQNY
jgi:hypothetical protein